jgi:hypothetical protein
VVLGNDGNDFGVVLGNDFGVVLGNDFGVVLGNDFGVVLGNDFGVLFPVCGDVVMVLLGVVGSDFALPVDGNCVETELELGRLARVGVFEGDEVRVGSGASLGAVFGVGVGFIVIASFTAVGDIVDIFGVVLLP